MGGNEELFFFFFQLWIGKRGVQAGFTAFVLGVGEVGVFLFPLESAPRQRLTTWCSCIKTFFFLI